MLVATGRYVGTNESLRCEISFAESRSPLLESNREEILLIVNSALGLWASRGKPESRRRDESTI